MAAPAKYLFDDDFARPGGAKPMVDLGEHAAKVKDAETNGFHRGFAAATAEAKASAEARAAAALERVGNTVEELNRGLSAVAAKLEGEAIEVAVAVAKKLAAGLIAREPFVEIAALATDCFRQLVAVPHVVVRINDALQHAAGEKLEEIVRARGLESRLVVLAEPDIAVGDCHIEWADGGVTRDSAAIATAIDEVVKRYLDAHPLRATP
jgi:flagellar assembly protein FliH